VEEIAGHRRIAEGREAEVFEWGDGTVLRLLRDAGRRPAMEQGAAAMSAAKACGVPVPAVVERVTVDGRPGLVLERIDGPDLFGWLAPRPWRLASAGKMLAALHVQLHQTRAPQELVSLRGHVRARIEAAPALSPELCDFALMTLDTLADGDRLCHGDFHPGNVLLTGDRPVVIDWTNATRGDATADFARTRLMLRLGEPPPGTPWVVRTLTPVGRAVLARRYARDYVARRPVDRSALARWEVVRAADRCSEGIDAEIPALIGFLERARGVRGAPLG
jgi:Phosphotransferase enzyme family